MDIEAEANLVAVADDAQQPQPEAETETNGLDTQTEGEPQVEMIEIERGGKTYQVPKELEGELLMQQDYTKKTMSLADERKALEAEATATRETLQLAQANIDLAANIKNLEAQKAQLEAIPGDQIQRLRAEDPAEYNRLVGDYQAVQTALANAKDQQTALKNELSSRAERAIATSHEKALEEAARTIPDFLARRPELEKLATEIGGYTDLKQASAGDYRLLDLVAEGLKAREARVKAAKQQAAAQAQPAAEIVKGRTPVVKPLDDRASVDAWMKARNEAAAKR